MRSWIEWLCHWCAWTWRIIRARWGRLPRRPQLGGESNTSPRSGLPCPSQSPMGAPGNRSSQSSHARGRLPHDCPLLQPSFRRTPPMTVGKTYVADTLQRQHYAILCVRRTLKHRVPPPIPRNLIWGMDLLVKTDTVGRQHVVLAIVDHASRACLCVQRVANKSSLTIWNHLTTTCRHYGCPQFLRTDNVAVFTSRRLRLALWCMGDSPATQRSRMPLAERPRRTPHRDHQTVAPAAPHQGRWVAGSSLGPHAPHLQSSPASSASSGKNTRRSLGGSRCVCRDVPEPTMVATLGTAMGTVHSCRGAWFGVAPPRTTHHGRAVRAGNDHRMDESCPRPGEQQIFEKTCSY